MSRKLAREVVMQGLYQAEINSFSKKEDLSYFVENSGINLNEIKYINDIFEIYFLNLNEINDLISKNLRNWTLDRISKIDLSILRLSLCEIKFYDSIPLNVSINEAVNLAKKFSDEESASYINGVLGNIVNTKECKE